MNPCQVYYFTIYVLPSRKPCQIQRCTIFVLSSRTPCQIQRCSIFVLSSRKHVKFNVVRYLFFLAGDHVKFNVVQYLFFLAGDHVKFNLPMAYSAWTLNYGFLQFRDAYVAAGQKDAMCESQRFVLDYFLNCWDSNSQTLTVMVRTKNTFKKSGTKTKK